jgi:hypothetical protein
VRKVLATDANFASPAELFNIFNHVNFSNSQTGRSSSSFGTITGAPDLRIGEMALKLFD